MESLHAFNRWIWTESFWIPSKVNVTWKDLENTPEMLESGKYFAQIQDLNWSFLLGILLLGVRFLYENLFVVPIARALGIKDRKRVVVQHNPILEEAFKKAPHLNDKTKVELSKRSDLPIRQIETWFRLRAARDIISTMQKFRECSWHFLFYLGSFVYGIAILWDKPWFWETKQCWIGWPKQYITRDVYWYYMIELGFYWSLLFTLMADHRRKDYKEMGIHHLTTMFLMYFSWVLNFVRVGTLVLLVHDASDYWMAAAKMAKYAKRKMATEIFFGMFALVWVISRLIIYPFVVIHCSLLEPYGIVMDSTFGSHIFFNSLLLLLQVLHIIWSYMIAKIILRKFKQGDISDVRSDSDSSEEEIQSTSNGRNGIKPTMNGYKNSFTKSSAT